MNKVKINLILINLFFLFFFNNALYGTSNFYIIAKVDNEIITNIDALQEINYLIALNNDLQKIDKKSLLNLATNSLIREKIKKNEISKKNEFLEVKKIVLDNIIQNYYKKLNLENLDAFKKYLAVYDINLKDIKEKIKIEILWNQNVYLKYQKLLNVNAE